MIRGTVQDIAGRKLTERSSSANRELLELFIEHAPAAMAMFDKDMRHIAASRRFLEMYGLEMRDILGRLHYEIFPELPERLREVHARCLAGAEMREDNEYFERADGTVQHARWAVQPWRDAAGAIGGIILFVEDTTERMRDQARLRRSEEQLRTILDAVDACIYLKDRQGRYLFANEAVRRLWKAELDEIVGFTDDKFFDAETVARVRVNDRRVLEDGETLRELEPAVVLAIGRSGDFSVVQAPAARSGWPPSTPFVAFPPTSPSACAPKSAWWSPSADTARCSKT